MKYDAIVVGSGATGSLAAETLVQGGMRVLLLDGGNQDSRYRDLVPDRSFETLRRNDVEQHRYLLGDALESLEAEPVTGGAQLTPPRKFITEGVARFLPFRSESFSPLESLAYGGLGAGWGLGCSVFDDEECTRVGLPVNEVRNAYNEVATRIGISGADDDARPFAAAHIANVQPVLPLDRTAAILYDNYRKRRARLNERGFFMGRPALALLSGPKDGRDPCHVNDSEFYSDAGRAAWRPWIAVDELRANPLLTYVGGVLALRFRESGDHVVVSGIDMATCDPVEFTGRRLVLACGALGTGRIVLRSAASRGQTIPLLCNQYTYLPTIIPSALGRAMADRSYSLCQLALYHKDETDVAMAYIYSYRSLMLFRLLKRTPVAVQDAQTLLQFMVSSLLIVGIHHPDSPSDENRMSLEGHKPSPSGDRLVIEFRPSDQLLDRVRNRVKLYRRALRAMGGVPFPSMNPGNGASIHYAGTLPFSDSGEPLRLHQSGRLNGFRNVFVADGSGFRYLPAKGLTLTLMANALLVARRLASS